MTNNIDYLSEDPILPQQRYALVSIVGPHMPQKCDVWGMKVRGVADSAERAKAMAQKLLKTDNDYDVFTVEVGKFFPLAVEPHEIGNVEYQNSQLNELVKSYLENRELANDHWAQRKNELIKAAIREGKSQEEMANKPEHPIVVIQRIRNLEESIAKTKEELEAFEHDLKLSNDKFATYTEHERQCALDELESALKNNSQTEIPKDKEMALDDIRDKLLHDLKDTPASSSTSHLTVTLDTITKYEQELEELQTLRSTLNKEKTPASHSRISKDIDDLVAKIDGLKVGLNNSKAVNDYINSNYSNSQYAHLNSDPHSAASHSG